MSDVTSLYWLRQDLRVSDNPALSAALRAGPTVAVYVLDEVDPWKWGAASRWWLHRSLVALGASLTKMGIPLILRRGDPAQMIPRLAIELGVSQLHASRLYSRPAIARDAAIAQALSCEGIAWHDHNAALLQEPWQIQPKSADFYKVYSPFSRAVMQEPVPPALPIPKKQAAPALIVTSDDIDAWGLLPTQPDWTTGFADWKPGERGAHDRLQALLESGIRHYSEGRDRPDKPYSSRLSPHLAFGEIGPRQIWHAIHATGEIDANRTTFLKEIVWREFAAHTLYHQPHLPDRPLDERFAAFPWQDAPDHLKAWQRGQTGYPIVDAGMRQLWQTGWMHNRVRMIVASFLIKHLLIPWQEGERWFWDTLVDADLASNAFNWQWVAGSGADAAPYFRIFNPMLQGQKFDPDGSYVRQYVPELARLPNKLIHTPWEASPVELAAAGIRLGQTYPAPIVDHAAARTRALAGFKALKAE